eukprot:g1879.t1
MLANVNIVAIACKLEPLHKTTLKILEKLIHSKTCRFQKELLQKLGPETMAQLLENIAENQTRKMSEAVKVAAFSNSGLVTLEIERDITSPRHRDAIGQA